MEKVFVVKNGDFREVNQQLQKGGKIKMITAVPQVVSAYGYSACEMMSLESHDKYTGDIYAYVVLELE